MRVSLTGGYSRLRKLKPDDVEQLIKWDNDPELYQLTGKKFCHQHDGVRWWQALARDRQRVALAIVNDEGQLIGDIELEHIAWRRREAELRVSIGDKTYWNGGYGSEAVAQMLQLAFDELKLKRVYLRVRCDNRRAVRAYQKLGFRVTARLKANGRLDGAAELWLMEVLSPKRAASSSTLPELVRV